MDGSNTAVVTRQQLYELVWRDPTRTVAKRLGISDVGLAKICRKLHIPRPWRGYWREKETGQRPRQPKLAPWPAHLGAEPKAISFRVPSTPSEPAPLPPPEPESVQQQRAYEAGPDHGLAVDELLADPDRLVRRALRLLRKSDERGVLRTSEHPCLDIHVTKGSIDRALRVFDTLLKAWRVRGWPVETMTEQPWHTRITVLDETFGVRLDERVRTSKAPRPPLKSRDWLAPRVPDNHEPTGQLTFRISDGTQYGRDLRTWSDGKRRRIENCLNDIMIGLVQAAEGAKAARRAEEQRRREWAEAEQRRQLEAERWEREKDRRQELQRQAEAWLQAQQLQDYVSALSEAGRDHLREEPDGRLARWVRWAETYVRELDPTQRLELLPHNPAGYGRVPIDLAEFGASTPPE